MSLQIWASLQHLDDRRVGAWSSHLQLEGQNNILIEVKLRLISEAAELRRDRDRLGALVQEA